MRLHFFTINDIEEYRKNYRYIEPLKKAFIESNLQTIEELDQAFFLITQNLSLICRKAFLNQKFTARQIFQV